MNWIKYLSLGITSYTFIKKYGWVKFRDIAETSLKTAGEDLETLVTEQDDSSNT